MEIICYTIEMVSAIYCMTDAVHFVKMKSYDNNLEYLCVSYDIDEIEGEKIYFDATDIPQDIKIIYEYSKQFSEINYDEKTKKYNAIGTHLMRANNNKYIIKKYDNNPITQKHIIYNYNISSSKNFNKKEDFYKSLMYEMIDVKTI